MKAFDLRKRAVRYGRNGAAVVGVITAVGLKNDWAALAGPVYWLVMLVLLGLGVSGYVLRDWLRWLEEERNEQKRILEDEVNRLKNQQAILNKEVGKTTSERDVLRQAACEAISGMPALNQLLTDFFAMQDGRLVNSLRSENRAYRAANVVQEQTALRREAEQQTRHLKAKVELYETLDPFLKECGKDVPFDPKQSQLAAWIRDEVIRLNYKLRSSLQINQGLISSSSMISLKLKSTLCYVVDLLRNRGLIVDIFPSSQTSSQPPNDVAIT